MFHIKKKHSLKIRGFYNHLVHHNLIDLGKRLTYESNPPKHLYPIDSHLGIISKQHFGHKTWDKSDV